METDPVPTKENEENPWWIIHILAYQNKEVYLKITAHPLGFLQGLIFFGNTDKKAVEICPKCGILYKRSCRKGHCFAV